jgi:site-specific DNA-cytosine methylase
MKFIKSIFLKRQFRLITGREAARLQGFPETFKIHKNEKK